jgi:hypothetical protein
VEVEKFIKEFKKATIDSSVKKNCGSGYSVDTCVILYSLGYPHHTKIKNFSEWVESVHLTVYNFILNEALRIINRDSNWYEVDEMFFPRKPPKYPAEIKSRLKEKLDRPEVRIVNDPKLYKTVFFRELNQELFENLSHENISLNDKKFLIVSDYEKNKIVSADKTVCTLASRYGLNYLETRITTKLPLVKPEISKIKI